MRSMTGVQSSLDAIRGTSGVAVGPTAAGEAGAGAQAAAANRMKPAHPANRPQSIPGSLHHRPGRSRAINPADTNTQAHRAPIGMPLCAIQSRGF
jgi:hypothetical protein